MTLEWNKGFVQSNSTVVLLAFQISNKTKPHQSLCGIFYQYQQWTVVLLTVLREINRKKKNCHCLLSSCADERISLESVFTSVPFNTNEYQEEKKLTNGRVSK